MAEHGFTRGPWAVSKNKARRVTSSGVIICNAVMRNQGGPKHKAFLKDEQEAEANARLIAASPTLLEALEQLLKDVDELMGSSEGVAGLHHNGDLAPWSELAEGGQFSDWIGHATAKARAAITLATGKDA